MWYLAFDSCTDMCWECSFSLRDRGAGFCWGLYTPAWCSGRVILKTLLFTQGSRRRILFGSLIHLPDVAVDLYTNINWEHSFSFSYSDITRRRSLFRLDSGLMHCLTWKVGSYTCMWWEHFFCTQRNWGEGVWLGLDSASWWCCWARGAGGGKQDMVDEWGICQAERDFGARFGQEFQVCRYEWLYCTDGSFLVQLLGKKSSRGGLEWVPRTLCFCWLVRTLKNAWMRSFIPLVGKYLVAKCWIQSVCAWETERG